MYIIADISLNFQTLDDIIEIIEKINANYIKLQFYSEKDLYGTGTDKTKLDLAWMPDIYQACKKSGKRLMCTVFNHTKVREIDKWVTIHKIASSEITYKDLLKEVRNRQKPIILSTGGATFGQIKDAIEILSPYLNTLLACDVEYPSKRHSIRNLLSLKNQFKNINVGYSDHSIDIYSMPILCQHYQATYYEKHVKPNEDHKSYEEHALTLNEFNEMVDMLSGKAPIFKPNQHQRVFNEKTFEWKRPRV